MPWACIDSIVAKIPNFVKGQRARCATFPQPIACQNAVQTRNRAGIMLYLNDIFRIEARILRKTRAFRKKPPRITNYPAIADLVIHALRPMAMNP